MSDNKPVQRWNEEEKNRLWFLRNRHIDLEWCDFHQLNYFPDRTERALRRAWHRMENERGILHDAPPTITGPTKRRVAHDPELPDGHQHKAARVRTIDDHATNFFDDEGNIDDGEMSVFDDGNIEPSGQRKPLQSSSLRSQELVVTRSPDKSQDDTSPRPSTNTRQVPPSSTLGQPSNPVPSQRPIAVPEVRSGIPEPTSRTISTGQQPPPLEQPHPPHSTNGATQPSPVQVVPVSAPRPIPPARSARTTRSESSQTPVPETSSASNVPLQPAPGAQVAPPILANKALSSSDGPALEASVRSEHMTVGQSLIAAGYELIRRGQAVEQEGQAPSPGEARLQGEIATLKGQYEQLQASRNEVTAECKTLREQLVAQAQQLEEMRVKLIELQDRYQSAEKWTFGDMFKVMAMHQEGRAGQSQSVS
ncbi:uncharacterized protein BJX67DRAFT_32746 [Aspergillus lucknowensis]|uniref:Myb-like domain-containing protein n=1 Tax=Aspergillus lucknowensis TaxID=176173 RepID=A0ABR4LX58_9EURO